MQPLYCNIKIHINGFFYKLSLKVIGNTDIIKIKHLTLDKYSDETNFKIFWWSNVCQIISSTKTTSFLWMIFFSYARFIFTVFHFYNASKCPIVQNFFQIETFFFSIYWTVEVILPLFLLSKNLNCFLNILDNTLYKYPITYKRKTFR